MKSSHNIYILFKKWINILLIIISFSPAVKIAPQTKGNLDKFQYLYPVPNSVMVSERTNIIIRFGKDINKQTISSDKISVAGSKSGVHDGELVLSDDNKTLVFNLYSPFVLNETVTVSLKEGIITESNAEVPVCTYYFTTVTGVAPQTNSEVSSYMNNSNKYPVNYQRMNFANTYLPQPTIIVDSVNNPSDGYIFLAAWDRNAPTHFYANYIFILDKNGSIIDSIRVNGAPFDFKIQPNGYLSYALGNFAGIAPGTGEDLKHYVMDTNFAVVDSFHMKNGYETDFHEFLYLPNGHVMLMSYHNIPYDMSKVVEGGQPNATLVIDILQEQDRNKNVVFEWRNLDYIPITNSTDSPDSSEVDLTQSRVHYATLNGFDLDSDGNIIASFRELSEIMKIDRTTGKILWRMGGKSKEFTFNNEHPENAPFFYSRQHNVKRLANGDISIFDNGDLYKNSRAAEYSVDEINKTATLVSEFRYPESLGKIASATAGSAEKLPDGGWFISYGALYPPNFSPVRHQIVESHADGSLALVITLPENVLAYRAYKLLWKELVVRPSDFLDNVMEGNNYPDNNHPKNTGIIVHYDSLSNAPYMGALLTRIPYGPIKSLFDSKPPIIYPVSIKYENYGGIDLQKAIFHVDLTKYPEIKHPASTSFYIRDSSNHSFTMLPTTYDNNLNKLTATVRSFGEIVFGEPDVTPSANVPIPFEPEKYNTLNIMEKDSVYLKWTGQGLYDFFRVQVSKDSMFSGILLDTTLKSSFLTIGNLDSTNYYWRVSSIVNSSNSDWTNVWEFKVEIITGVDYNNNLLPKEYYLSQNFPNPFNPSTSIVFSIPSAQLVVLEVYDILGQQVKTLINNEMRAGNYKFNFNADDLSSGIYFYKLRAGSFSQVKKMILLR